MEGFKNSEITVVDDDRMICESPTEAVRSWKLRAEGFTGPEAALEAIMASKCYIILLDDFINDVCVLDLIPRIGNDLKIIVITGLADKDIAIRALKLGAFDLLGKPFRALAVFAQNIDREREESKKRIASKLRSLIIPMIMRLRNDPELNNHEIQLDILTRQIEDLTSGFAMDSDVAMTLSFTELQIASLIKDGLTTEEIAGQLHIAKSTARTHRKNIRKKLKINKAQFSLRDYLNRPAESQGSFARTLQ